VLRVGLTGGVASGKSSVAALLAARGAAVRDADALVAELYEPGTMCGRAIAERFGVEVLAANGSVDRRALGRLVLGDTEARRWLESVVHPEVRAAVTGWLERLDASLAPPAVAVVEAALLVETGAWEEYDRLVVVTAPLPLRRQRAVAAGWDLDVFERMLAAQLDDAAREAVADYVVCNAGERGALATAAGSLWAHLQDDAAAPRPLQRRRPALRLG